MYDDYAISETLFHWQSHNAYGPDTTKGILYKSSENHKKIISLMRGNTMGYVFIGEGF
jgi:hypothetical protein